MQADDLDEKIRTIDAVIDDCDVPQIIELCMSRGGLVKNIYRRKGWMKILEQQHKLDELFIPLTQCLSFGICPICCQPMNLSAYDDFSATGGSRVQRPSAGDGDGDSASPPQCCGCPREKQYISNKHCRTIFADVHRSASWLEGVKFSHDRHWRDCLLWIIFSILAENNDLQYFQGYNVVCSVFLRIFDDPTIARQAILYVTSSHFQHLMKDDPLALFAPLFYIYPIIGRAQPDLRDFLEDAELSASVCVSWVVTWLGHQLGAIEFEDIARLFDVFVATPSDMPVYFSAALIINDADQVLACSCEMSEVFSIVQGLVTNAAGRIEDVIQDAIQLREDVPLEDVRDEAEQLLEDERSQQKRMRARRQRRNEVGLLQRNALTRSCTDLVNGIAVATNMNRRKFLWMTVAGVVASASFYVTLNDRMPAAFTKVYGVGSILKWVAELQWPRQ